MRAELDALLRTPPTELRKDLDGYLAKMRRGLEVARELGDPVLIIRANRAIALLHSRRAEHPAAFEHIDKALELCRELGDDGWTARTMYARGEIYLNVGRHAEAIEGVRFALTIFERENNIDLISGVLGMLGVLYSKVGRYDEAIEPMLRSLEIAESMGDTYHIVAAYNDLAAIHYLSGNIERAVSYFERSRDLARKENDELSVAIALSNIGGCRMEQLELEAAIEIELEALAIFERLGYHDRAAITTQVLGRIYKTTGRPDLAVECFDRSRVMLERSGNDDQLAPLYVEIADLHAEQGNWEECLELRLKALPLAEAQQDVQLRSRLHEGIAGVHEARGELREALFHQKEFQRLDKELMTTERQRAIIEMQARFDSERLERENEIQRLKLERMEREVEHKNRELTLLAMQLVQKSECMENVRDRMRSLNVGDDASVDILHQLQSALGTDADWETFARQFQQVHPRFQSRLAELYPGLTPAELKVCCLIRVGLSTKEIAGILFTSHRTVENQRASIRRKLALRSATSVTTFLAGIS